MAREILIKVANPENPQWFSNVRFRQSDNGTWISLASDEFIQDIIKNGSAEEITR